LNLRAIRSLGFGCFLSLVALPLAAAPKGGRISGVVLDPAGTPQMGATVLVSSDGLLSPFTIQMLSNEQGHFSAAGLRAGTYSVKVTLAGFLPAIEQHVEVNDQRLTLLEIVLGSVFSSFEKLRRQPEERVASDDWTWVLRTSASTRSVLEWQDGEGIVGQTSRREEAAQSEANHGRLVLTSGMDRPVGDSRASPATAFVYDLGIGPQAQFLMAGRFSYGGVVLSSALAGEWLPSGRAGVGPVTTVVVRESRIGPDGPLFRGLRITHDDQLALSDRISVRYGGEYVVAEYGGGTAAALRPRGEVGVQLSPNWQASVAVATRAWEGEGSSQGALESTLNALDTFPTLMIRHSRPVLESGLHEEMAIERAFGEDARLSAAVFHDGSTHTAVLGRGASSTPDFLADSFSQAFAYDGGRSSSAGVRAAYRQTFGSNVNTTLVYAYAGALAPNGRTHETSLREELSTQYRHSLAARISARVPRVGTSFSAGYKWLSGPTVSQQDAYGQSIYRIDPYLSLEICQPLPGLFPGHMEVHADAGNLLAERYVSVATTRGGLLLVPSYRFFRGGLSFQF
jgi:Carboxypeptidase regulatory-like domain